jgi:NDP-sugar pyrophosphorylase family protein
MCIAPENTDVVILCGGLGTRLRECVSDRPKPMADIQQTPFVQILIEQFRGFGFRRFILCTGYMSEVVKSYFEDYAGDAEIVISEEPKPLGTAGAIRHAQGIIRSDPFLVTNGDSYCSVPLDSFCEFHAGRAAEMSMVVTTSDQSEDYGSVGIDQTGRITSFQEKTAGTQFGMVSAGIYLLQRHIFQCIPPGTTCSLELDVFPRLMGRCCYAYVNAAPVFDIGTPERLAQAENYFVTANVI